MLPLSSSMKCFLIDALEPVWQSIAKSMFSCSARPVNYNKGGSLPW